MPASPPLRPRPPAPPIIGRPLEPLFRAAVALRNLSFDAGLRVQRMRAPVISVGNLSVGGTGKTPMVRWVVRTLQDMGRTPCIAMRGYARSGDEASDEEAEHRAALPGVPIAVGANRERALRELLDRMPSVDCATLDDGFQRRTLGRELDIVLLDATRSPFDDRCLPAGWLREPIAALRRAGVIVATHAEQVSTEEASRLVNRIRGAAPEGVVAVARHDWSAVEVAEGGGATREAPLDWLRGRRVHALCAIGNPSAFLAQAREAGVTVASAELRRDHSSYGEGDVLAAREALRAVGAEAVLTTAKDWVKLARHAGAAPGVLWARPRLEIRFDEGEGLVRAALARAVSGARAAASAGAAVLR